MSDSSTPSSASANDDSRFSPITDHDKAGVLWIASLLAGVYAVLSMIVRSYIKRKCFGQDDWVCLAATVVGAGSFSAVYIGLSQGLGKGFVTNPTELQAIGRAVYASRITWVFGIALAKASVIFLIKRLFSQDMVAHRRLCNIVLVTVAFWTLGAIVGVSVDCEPRHLVDDSTPSCQRQFLRWEIIGIFDAITELLIMLLSCGLVWRLQMRLELKIRVILAFLFRAPLIIIIALHVRYTYTMRGPSTNLEIIPPLAIETIALGYALISATIPNLKSFIMSFDTAMMMDLHGYRQRTTPSTTATSSKSRLFWQSTRRLQYSDASAQDELIGRLRPERVEHRAEAHRVDDREAEMEDLPGSRERESQSQEGRIRMDFGWRIDEEFAVLEGPVPRPPVVLGDGDEKR